MHDDSVTRRAGALPEAPALGQFTRYPRGVKKPVTVPWIVAVPSGPEKSVWSGIVQVIVFFSGAALADVSVSLIVVPPVGVNEKVVLNAVGMNTDVLPTTCAGVNSPLPFTTTMTFCPLHVAKISAAFLAFVGSAVATEVTTAQDARQAARTSSPRFIALPFR
jgi:hypothetical protein